MATEYPTLPQRLLDAVDQYRSPRAQIFHSGGQWRDIPAQEMLRRIAGLSAALTALGVREGDRVALFAPNSPEWHTADFATLGLGAVVVPIYFRESPERIEYILRHAEPKVAFAAGAGPVSTLLRLRDSYAQRGGPLASLEHIIVAAQDMETASVASAPSSSGGAATLRNGLPDDVLRYETLISSATEAEITAYRRSVAELALRPPGSGRLASIIYTSGTTGEPKGVMLSHSNFVSNEIASFEGFPCGPEDRALSFLPLAHVYERTTDYGFLFRGIQLAYLARPEEVSAALVQVQPTIVAAVPRFFEKLYATVMERGAQATGLKRKLFDWAIRVARASIPWRAYGQPVSAFTRLQWKLADRLVYQKFRAGIGGRVRHFVSGGAPLAKELVEFFTAVGLPVYQGYGLTETSPVIAWNKIDANHVGTVGRPVPHVEVRIADDGEVLARGPCVMMGYYKNEEATRAAISSDGWFATGDIGYLDDGGYLVITDRKKELLKTAGGKFVAPAPMENALKSSPYILNAALVGDRRRFIAALIVPNFPNVEARAREAGVTFSSPTELAASPWVHKLIEDEIARINAHLAQFETVKRFALLDRDFTFDGGELTYTLKLKRRVIEQRYASIIESLYADPAPSPARQ